MTRVVALTFAIVLGLIVGCESGKSSGKSAAANPGVLDVTPAAPIPANEPVAAAQPISDVQPISYTTNVPTAAPASKQKYIVKKGDTLFSIAKASYGTGKDWQKIASANPGLEPAKLKVGQQIVIP